MRECSSHGPASTPPHAARYPQDFSGGKRQRIGIARRWRMGSPVCLVLDEPSPRSTCDPGQA
ncbi:hypothetical protein GCM10020220_091490 [Nonomuraea rubra]|uniref:hypothetical protein n=1 Tax=Nonomuraea rubra TaxID=46180 RepID=UPI0031EA370A